MSTKRTPLGSVSQIVRPTDQTDNRPTNNVDTGGPASHRLNRMLRLRELSEFVGLRRTQIGELIKAGQFPKPIPLSDAGRAVAWLESDLIAWQNARIAVRNASIAKRDETKGGE
jgi:prophage regulatory protein